MINEHSITVSARIAPSNCSAIVTAELRRQYTTQSPPLIDITFTNTSSTPEQFDFGFTPPFSVYELSGDTGDKKLVCVPPKYPGCSNNNCIPETQSDGCWTAAEIPDILDSGTLTTLSPEESFEQRYAVLNHPSNEECFPSGRYTGKDTFDIDGLQSTCEIILAVEVAGTSKPEG